MGTVTQRPSAAHPRRRRHPLLNRLVLALLRSPVHGVLDPGLCELRYHARLTGRQVSVPVLYAARGDRFVVVVGDADAKQWWRNFVRPYPVRVCRGGECRSGMGRVVPATDPGYADAVELYLARHDIGIEPTDRVLLIETADA